MIQRSAPRSTGGETRLDNRTFKEFSLTRVALNETGAQFLWEHVRVVQLPGRKAHMLRSDWVDVQVGIALCGVRVPTSMDSECFEWDGRDIQCVLDGGVEPTFCKDCERVVGEIRADAAHDGMAIFELIPDEVKGADFVEKGVLHACEQTSWATYCGALFDPRSSTVWFGEEFVTVPDGDASAVLLCGICRRLASLEGVDLASALLQRARGEGLEVPDTEQQRVRGSGKNNVEKDNWEPIEEEPLLEKIHRDPTAMIYDAPKYERYFLVVDMVHKESQRHVPPEERARAAGAWFAGMFKEFLVLTATYPSLETMLSAFAESDGPFSFRGGLEDTLAEERGQRGVRRVAGSTVKRFQVKDGTQTVHVRTSSGWSRCGSFMFQAGVDKVFPDEAEVTCLKCSDDVGRDSPSSRVAGHRWAALSQVGMETDDDGINWDRVTGRGSFLRDPVPLAFSSDGGSVHARGPDGLKTRCGLPYNAAFHKARAVVDLSCARCLEKSPSLPVAVPPSSEGSSSLPLPEGKDGVGNVGGQDSWVESGGVV